MRKWADWIQEDHQVLEAHVSALRAALALELGATDRRIALEWFARNLEPVLERHLGREETLILPRLQQSLEWGEEIDVVAFLKRRHQELRGSLKRLLRLLETPGPWALQEAMQAGEEFAGLLEDHETKDRLIAVALESSLELKDLYDLADAFRLRTAVHQGFP